MHYATHSDHNVVNAALETLNVLLQNCPAQLRTALVNPSGISKSRISYFEGSGRYKLRSPSVLSVATTLMSGEDSFESELTDSVQTDIEKWINESKLSVGNVVYYAKAKEEDKAEMAHVPLVKDASVESAYSAGYGERSGGVLENLDKSLLSESSSEKSESVSPAAEICVRVS